MHSFLFGKSFLRTTTLLVRFLWPLSTFQVERLILPAKLCSAGSGRFVFFAKTDISRRAECRKKSNVTLICIVWSLTDSHPASLRCFFSMLTRSFGALGSIFIRCQICQQTDLLFTAAMPTTATYYHAMSSSQYETYVVEKALANQMGFLASDLLLLHVY